MKLLKLSNGLVLVKLKHIIQKCKFRTYFINQNKLYFKEKNLFKFVQSRLRKEDPVRL